ncbi:MAG: serine hydrolase [bacterium]|nr:serine hydrolase [bacterium]
MKLKQIFFIMVFLLVVFITGAAAQNPRAAWQQYETPEEAGFSSAKLEEAKKRYDESGAAAFMVVINGKVLVSWGDVERRFVCHSMRKSLISALYGIHVDNGAIDINKTLAALKIPVRTPLTEEEHRAVIKDLLKARSGIYLPAAAETAWMKARRPKRGSHKPGTFWYYNNWDFNVLGTIFRQETGADIFEDFKKRLADPLQMEDYRIIDGFYYYQREYSDHPAYHFKLSARDSARFGLLFQQEGKWNGKQIISGKWVKESTTSYSETDKNGGGYGYLWWLHGKFRDEGMYMASGVGSQVIAVFPRSGMVMVQRVNTYKGAGVRFDPTIVRMILDAKVSEPKPEPKLVSLQNVRSVKRPPLIQLPAAVLDKYVKQYDFDDDKVAVNKVDGDLVMLQPTGNQFKLLPVSRSVFIMESIEWHVLFEFDEKGNPYRLTAHREPEAMELYSAIIKHGAAPVLKKYREKKAVDRLSGDELNFLGYQFLGIKEIKTAIEVFKLNVELNPKLSYVYGSLGEAYVKAGDTESARRNFKKALELNPKDRYAKKNLEKLN